jgi:hypothetical protein
MMILKFEWLAFTCMGNVRFNLIVILSMSNDNKCFINVLRPSTLKSPSSKYSIL